MGKASDFVVSSTSKYQWTKALVTPQETDTHTTSPPSMVSEAILDLEMEG